MEFDLENPLSNFHDLHYHSSSESIPSLFQFESDHMPSQNYSQRLMSTDFDFSVRRESIPLILHLSCNFDPFISYLSINYLDRFLSTQGIPQGKPWVVRLLAVSCVSLALKMTGKTDYAVSDIQHDEGFIFDTQTIERMELLILGALQWRMRSVTPFSFINFFISFFKFKDPPLVQALKARATEIIFKAQTDIKILEFRPSIIAASALLSSSHELFPLQFPCFRKEISTYSYVNKDKLFSCCNAMQEIAMDGYESVLERVSSSITPVTVLDRQCSSSSWDSEKTNSSEAVEEREMKRQKISTSYRQENSFQLSQFQHC